MFVHPLSLRGVFSSILYVTFHIKIQKKNEKISTASLKNSKDVSAPSSRFSKYGGLGNMNRKYLEMQFLCTYVGIVSIMAFELCTCSWKANVYTPIFLLFSTKKALHYSQNRDPKVLQCIYHTLDSGRDKYVEKSFPIAYFAHTLYVLFCRHGNRCKQFCLGNCSQK